MFGTQSPSSSLFAPSKTTPLDEALKNGKVGEVKRLLEESKTDINYSENGKYPLLTAAALGRSECVKLLLTHGARTDVVDEKGFTALMYAAKNNDITTAAALFQHMETDANKANLEGHTAIWIALINAYKNRFTINTNYTVMVGLLLDKGANPNVKDKNGLSLQDFVEGFEEEWRHGFAYSTRLNLKNMLSSQIKLSAELKENTAHLDSVVSKVKREDFKSDNDFVYAQVRRTLEDYLDKKSDPILQIAALSEDKDYYNSIVKDIKRSDYVHELFAKGNERVRLALEERTDEEFRQAQDKCFINHYFQTNKAGHTLQGIVGVSLGNDKRMIEHFSNEYLGHIADAMAELRTLQQGLMRRKKEELNPVTPVPKFQEMLEHFEKHDWVNYCPGLIKAFIYSRTSLGKSLAPNPVELERFVSNLTMC